MHGYTITTANSLIDVLKKNGKGEDANKLSREMAGAVQEAGKPTEP
jgi:pentatricopeptide repeat protein